MTVTTPADLPDFLSHYYERERGPFRSLSDLPPAEAERLLEGLRRRGDVFASQRAPDYLAVRRSLEERVRGLFVARGGRPVRARPHYLVLGECPWLRTWYRDAAAVRLPLAAVNPAVVSFTYGDTFPAMRYQDGKATRGQVYTLEELPALVVRFGLPQAWNADGVGGPDRYIEAQLWSDAPLAALDDLDRGISHR